MKKKIIFCIFAVLSMGINAQTNYRFTSAASINDYVIFGYGAKLGYKFGPGIEFNKEQTLFTTTYGLDFLIASKGTSGSDYSGKYEMQLHYIEIPATVTMKFGVSKDWKIGWINGLYAAYAFRGKSKTNDEAYVSAFSDKNIWGKKMPRIDFGFLTGLSIERGRYMLSVNFEFGLMPLVSESYLDSEIAGYYEEGESFTGVNIGGFISFSVKL